MTLLLRNSWCYTADTMRNTVRPFIGGLIATAAFLIFASASASAQSSVNLNVAVAYHKNGNKYNIVVKDTPSTKLELYVNDKSPTKATVNKKNWATFNGVALTGNSGKLSFTKIVNDKQQPINYTRRYTIKNSKVSFGNYSPSSSTASANTTGDKITAWDSKYGSVFTTLGNDLSTFSKDAEAGNVSAAGADCQQMQTDIATAQNEAAIPDSTVEQHWSSALSDLSAAAQDCVQGVNNNDVTLIQQANSEITQGNTQLADTTTAIEQASN